MAVGACLLALAMPLGLIGFALATIPGSEKYDTLGGVFRAAFFVAQAPALFLLCSFEGRLPERQQRVRLAAWMIAAVGVMLAGAIVVDLLMSAPIQPLASDPEDAAIGVNGGHFGRSMWTTSAIVIFVSKVVLIASAALTGTWVNALARRANIRGLATISRLISFTPLFGFLLALPLFVIWFTSAVWMVVSIAVLVYLLIAPVPLVWLAMVLKRTAGEAVAMWAAETKPV